MFKLITIRLEIGILMLLFLGSSALYPIDSLAEPNKKEIKKRRVLKRKLRKSRKGPGRKKHTPIPQLWLTAPSFFYSTIQGTDQQNQSLAELISNINFGIGLSALIHFGPKMYWRPEIRLDSYSYDVDQGKRLVDADPRSYLFAAGFGRRFYSGTRGELKLGLERQVVYRATDANTFELDGGLAPFLGFRAEQRLYRFSKTNEIGAKLDFSMIGPNISGPIEYDSGVEYGGAFYLTKKVFNKHIRGELFYSQKTSETESLSLKETKLGFNVIWRWESRALIKGLL